MKKTIDCLTKDNNNLIRYTYSYKEEDLIFVFNKEDNTNKYIREMLDKNELNFISLYSLMAIREENELSKEKIIEKIISLFSILNYETKKIIIVSDEDKKSNNYIFEDKKATINKFIIDLIDEKKVIIDNTK